MQNTNGIQNAEYGNTSLDLARQLALELAGVELGDGADAALACAGCGPAVGGVISKRRCV